MRKFKAVFFDIDGTLVSFNSHKVPQPTIDALAQLRENGIKIFIATGRMLSMVTTALNDIPFDGYIAYNGALCVNARGEEIFSNPLPRQDLEALARRLVHDPFPVAFLGKKEMTVNYVNDAVKLLAEHINVPVPRVQDIRETMETDTIYQACIYVDEEREKQIMADVFTNCEASRWTNLFADVNIRGNSKSTGIDHMLHYYNIDLNDTMAFGDGGNDMQMLQHVAVGVAMGNANEKVKLIADYITDTVDNEGIPKALKQFGLL